MTRVDVFNLNVAEDKEDYETIINKHLVIRDEFAYSKLGEAIITVWYVVESED